MSCSCIKDAFCSLLRLRPHILIILNKEFAAYQKEAKRFARWLQKIPDDYFITKQKKS